MLYKHLTVFISVNTHSTSTDFHLIISNKRSHYNAFLYKILTQAVNTLINSFYYGSTYFIYTLRIN